MDKTIAFKQFLQKEEEINNILKNSEFGDFSLSTEAVKEEAIKKYIEAMEKKTIDMIDEYMMRFLRG
tara:strand:- start:701 stop:901 length:201 start_codon:yes stop_codon:yes gene_type:complete